MTPPHLGKKDLKALSHFCYLLRRFLHFSEEAPHQRGITHLQYQLLHRRGLTGREWTPGGDLAERLQAQR